MFVFLSVIAFFMLFIAMLKSVGDITAPCGVPLTCVLVDDSDEPTLTWNVRSLPKFCM